MKSLENLSSSKPQISLFPLRAFTMLIVLVGLLFFIPFLLSLKTYELRILNNSLLIKQSFLFIGFNKKIRLCEIKDIRIIKAGFPYEALNKNAEVILLRSDSDEFKISFTASEDLLLIVSGK